MGDINDILKSVPGEAVVERLIGNIDVERADGTVEHDLPMYRKEILEDMDDIESVCEREYYAMKEGDIDEEIFLGDSVGNNVTIKERTF